MAWQATIDTRQAHGICNGCKLSRIANLTQNRKDKKERTPRLAYGKIQDCELSCRFAKHTMKAR